MSKATVLTMQRCGFALACILLSSSGVVSSEEPTVEKVASYSLDKILLFMALGGYKDLRRTASMKNGVDVFRVTYSPGMVPGSPGDPDAVLSGLLFLPSELPGTLSTVAIIHGTLTNPNKVPSNAFASEETLRSFITTPNEGYGDYAVFGGLAVASMGFAGIAPDGLGMGDDSGKGVAYPYAIRSGYAITTFNLHMACRQLVPTISTNKLSDTMFTAGYSEGGYGALAVHRASHKTDWAGYNVTVGASHPAGGPYDLGYTQLQDSFRNAVNYTRPSFFAYVGYSYTFSEGVENIFVSEDLSNDVQDWFTSGLSAVEINEKIADAVGADPRDMFSEDVVEAIEHNHVDNEFVARLVNNTLSTPFSPMGGSEVRLCHGAVDELVYVSNAYRTAMHIPSKSHQLNIIDKHSCSSHQDCALDCLEVFLGQLEKEKTGPWYLTAQGIGVIMSAAVAVIAVIIYVVYKKSSERDAYNLIA